MGQASSATAGISPTLTGDGRPEEVQLVASGASVDGLTVTLTVLSGFELLHAAELPADVPADDRVARLQAMAGDLLDRQILDPGAFVAARRPRDVPGSIARDRGEPLDLEAAAVI